MRVFLHQQGTKSFNVNDGTVTKMWEGPQKIFSMITRLYTLRDAELNIPTEISFIRSKEVETNKKKQWQSFVCVLKK